MKNPDNISRVDPASALSPREEVAALLAWQSTGRLSRREQDQVDSYLAAHPEDEALRDAVHDEAREVRRANSDIAAPSRVGFDRLLATLPPQAAQSTPKAQATWKTPRVSVFARWQERCVEFLASLSPNQMGWATAVFAALVLTQVALIGTVIKRPPGKYEVASGPTERVIGGNSNIAPVAVLAFVLLARDASTEAMTKVLAEIGCEIVGGPKSGLYRIALTAGSTTAEATTAALNRLKQHPELFARVLPAPKL